MILFVERFFVKSNMLDTSPTRQELVDGVRLDQQTDESVVAKQRLAFMSSSQPLRLHDGAGGKYWVRGIRASAVATKILRNAQLWPSVHPDGYAAMPVLGAMWKDSKGGSSRSSLEILELCAAFVLADGADEENIKVQMYAVKDKCPLIEDFQEDGGEDGVDAIDADVRDALASENEAVFVSRLCCPALNGITRASIVANGKRSREEEGIF